MKLTSLALLICVGIAGIVSGEEPPGLDRCQIVPLANHEVSLRIDGVEKTRWHYGAEYPRPFFFPFRGPSGAMLTRMGHPGAPDHDHHRSVWFAHHAVDGLTFWSDTTDTQVRQEMWYCFTDGPSEAIMAIVCGWYDGDGQQLMQQDLVAALLPLPNNEHALELQITLRPSKDRDSVELGKTNFGLLAVRVAKSLSARFGGGELTDSEARRGEKEIFGNRARWMDYSGPVAVGSGPNRKTVVEGITYFDHPDNPRYPTHWHVRSDGWMGASFCMQQ